MPRDEITTLDYWLDGVNEETESPVVVPGLFTYTYPFMYRGERQKVVIHISHELYQWAKDEHIRKQKVSQSPKKFILERLSAAEQTPVFDELLGELRRIKDYYHLDEDEYLELLVYFVQKCIWYDGKKRKKFLMSTSITAENFNSYLFGDADISFAQRFPVETLVEGCGMCLEKSMLLAALLRREGYATAIFLFSCGLHAAVGVRVPLSYGWGYFAHDGKDSTTYAYIEPTEVAYVGDYSYVKHTNPPTATIEIGNGEKEYQAMEMMSRILHRKEQLIEKIKHADERSKKLELDITKYSADTDSLEKKLHELEKKMTEIHGDDFERIYSEYSEIFKQHDILVSRTKEMRSEYMKIWHETEHDKGMLEFILKNMNDKKKVIEEIEIDDQVM